jgi:RNA polymerase sigma factor (sigma-70 family)
MPAPDDLTRWISKLGGGDAAAAQVVWQQYFARLVRFARRKLGDLPHRTFDEEDVALSAMYSFYRGLEEGRFERLADRDELWKLLVTITARKIYAQQRHVMREKRGGGHVRGESAFQQTQADEPSADGIGEVLGREPSPELAAMLVENTQTLLDGLGDETLSQIARLKLEGYSTDEIAQRLGCVRRTVERKLERIREKWAKKGLAE